MKFPAAQIGLLVNGKIEGDPNVVVSSFGKIEEAKNSSLLFLPIPNTKSIYTAPMLLLSFLMKLMN